MNEDEKKKLEFYNQVFEKEEDKTEVKLSR